MRKGDFQMLLANEQLKSIYFGALHFKETEDGYLQAFQYTDSQMDYSAIRPSPSGMRGAMPPTARHLK